MKVSAIKLKHLRQAYEESGPKKGEPLVLLHGWPDSPRTWDHVLPFLHKAGFRTIAPYIRGYGPSIFRDPVLGRKRRRIGQPVAIAQDIIELTHRLGIKRFHFIGHDWGARVGYALSTVFHESLKSHVALSVPFAPGKAQPPKLPQAQAFWYQWLLCTHPGVQLFRNDPIAFGRAQWDTWSPQGWYTEADFKQTSASWENPDFAAVVQHYYRFRWGHAEQDPKYALLQNHFEEVQSIHTPTSLIHGAEDGATLLDTSEGAERYFKGPYQRNILEGIGHFPQREAPGMVADIILEHLQSLSSRPILAM